MLHSYRSFDPSARINGDSIRTVLDTFQLKQQAQEILTQHGLPAEPAPGQWYPWQAWLDVLAHLEQAYGTQTVYAAGLHVVNVSVWPPNIRTFHQALLALDQAYRANIQGITIGSYTIQTRGPREIRVVCYTPNPLAFDCGIITGLVRKFKPVDAIRVQVNEETTPPDASENLKWFRLTWGVVKQIGEPLRLSRAAT